MPKIVAFPVPAAVKLDVVVVKKNSTVDGGETMTSRGPLSLETWVRLRKRCAEGGSGRNGLLCCRTPLSICRPKYLVAGAAAANCCAGSQMVPLPRLAVGELIIRGPGVGTIEEYMNGALPAVKDCGVHDIGVVGFRARGGRNRFPSSLLKFRMRCVPRASGNNGTAAAMVMDIVQHNGRSCSLIHAGF